jgi:nicotinamidase-related amidase
MAEIRGVGNKWEVKLTLGYHVTLVVDAMTDLDAEAHQYSVRKIFPRLGETVTTQDALKLLRLAVPTPPAA